ncbi:Scramblase [Dictyocaulus viviparus]|uniref:Phospholipid scramblase n=1 Tax=Dictyocaulus viviparus TaxID=29172 RepID=A0A0D8Y6Y2_DICVI|nr:Scramblase [Dictyocaulus viviparus]
MLKIEFESKNTFWSYCDTYDDETAGNATRVHPILILILYQVFYALEQSSFCEQQCCGSYRSFTIHIFDNFSRSIVFQRIIRIERPFMCCGGAFCGLLADLPNYASRCTIEDPLGSIVGTVRQRGTLCKNVMELDVNNGAFTLYVHSSFCCLMSGCQDKKFLVLAVFLFLYSRNSTIAQVILKLIINKIRM